MCYSWLSCNMSPVAIKCLILTTLSGRIHLWRRAEGPCFWFVLGLALCPAIALMGDISVGSSVPSCCFLPSVFLRELFSQTGFYISSGHTHKAMRVCTYMILHSHQCLVCAATSGQTTLQRSSEWLLYLGNIWILIWVKHDFWGEEAWKKEGVY